MASRVMLATSASVTGLVRGVWAATGSTAEVKRAAAANERNRRKGGPFKKEAFLNNNGRRLILPAGRSGQKFDQPNLQAVLHPIKASALAQTIVHFYTGGSSQKTLSQET